MFLFEMYKVSKMEDNYLIYILDTFSPIFSLYNVSAEKASLLPPPPPPPSHFPLPPPPSSPPPPRPAKVYWRCLFPPSWATGGLFFPFQREGIFFFILVEIFSGSAFFLGTSVFGHSNEYVANLLISFRDALIQSQSLPWLYM